MQGQSQHTNPHLVAQVHLGSGIAPPIQGHHQLPLPRQELS